MKAKPKQIVKEEPAPVAEEVQIQKRSVQLVRASDVIPQELLKQALDNHESVEVIERLVALAKDVRAQQAREAWFDAMSEFQRAAPKILKSREVDAGRYKFRYAPLDEIMEAIAPRLAGLGLSVAWTHRIEERSVTACCHISHSLGHVQSSGDVVMPIPEALPGGAGATAPQRVGIALSYAKRYSLMAITGIAPRDLDGEEETPAPVQMPRRKPTEPENVVLRGTQQPTRPKAEEPAVQAPGKAKTTEPAGNEWRGRIKDVEVKKGSNWTAWIVKGEDGFEAGTYSESLGEFAIESKGSEVVITWEPGKKDRKKILTLEPAIDEPGSDDGPEY